MFSGGCAAHGGHGNGCVSLLYCLVKNFAKYVVTETAMVL